MDFSFLPQNSSVQRPRWGAGARLEWLVPLFGEEVTKFRSIFCEEKCPGLRSRLQRGRKAVSTAAPWEYKEVTSPSRRGAEVGKANAVFASWSVSQWCGIIFQR